MIEDDDLGLSAGDDTALAEAPEQTGASPSWPSPNQRHVERLKADPSLADYFEEKFGPGSAAKVMGVGVTETAKAMAPAVESHASEWWGRRTMRDLEDYLDAPRRYIRSALGLPDAPPVDPMETISRAVIEPTARAVAGMGELQKGAVRGIFSTKEIVGEGLEQYGKSLGSEGLSEYGDKVSEEGKAIGRNVWLRSNIESFTKIKKERWVADTADYLAGKLGEGIGNIAMVGAVYSAGGIAGSAGFLATMSIGEVRGELKDAGIRDEATLATYAYSAGLTIAALEAVFPAHVLRELSAPAKQEIARHIARVTMRASAGGAWREGLTEGLQEAVLIAATAHALDAAAPFDTVPVIEAFKRDQSIERIIDAIVGGALPGGVIGGQTAALRYAADNQPRVQEARVRSGGKTTTDATPEAPSADTRTVAPRIEGQAETPAGTGAIRTETAPPVASEALERVRGLLARSPAQTAEEPSAASPEAPARIPTDAEVEAELPARAAEIEDFYREAEWEWDLDDADVRAVARSMIGGQDVEQALEGYFQRRHGAVARERGERPEGAEQAKPEDGAGDPAEAGGGLPAVGRDGDGRRGEAAPAVDGEPGVETGRQDATGQEASVEVTDQQRSAFARVIAGKARRPEWGRLAGVTPEQLRVLVDEAVAEGRLEMRGGEPRRTARSKEAPAARPRSENVSRATKPEVAAKQPAQPEIDHDVLIEFEAEDGRRGRLTMPGSEALRMLDRRLKALDALARCLG